MLKKFLERKMNNKKRITLRDLINAGVLHQNEAWLIIQCREKYRFAKFVVITQDGLPQGIERGILKDRPPKNYDKKLRDQ